jgi:hypothetical protein
VKSISEGKKKSFRQFSKSQLELKNFMDSIDDSDSMADVDMKENGTTIYSERCQVFNVLKRITVMLISSGMVIEIMKTLLIILLTGMTTKPSNPLIIFL